MAAFTFAEVGRHLDNWFEWLAAYLTPRPNSIHAMNSTGWAQLTQVVYSEVVLPEEYNRGDTSLRSLYAGAHFVTDEEAEIGPIEIFDDDESEIVDRNRLGAALRIAITTRAQMFDAPEDVPGDEIDQLTDLIMKV
ncbi:hypothetical protein [uncultured Brevundimonas sp.]|uniref:hypothetical protein n=1 Tax=uncultured Brevundimonas sp. TaxID=213418 RepID=UPI0025E79110|nr:hypothetical protein [uncultured Brevundimonas sp.]